MWLLRVKRYFPVSRHFRSLRCPSMRCVASVWIVAISCSSRYWFYWHTDVLMHINPWFLLIYLWLLDINYSCRYIPRFLESHPVVVHCSKSLVYCWNICTSNLTQKVSVYIRLLMITLTVWTVFIVWDFDWISLFIDLYLGLFMSLLSLNSVAYLLGF